MNILLAGSNGRMNSSILSLAVQDHGWSVIAGSQGDSIESYESLVHDYNIDCFVDFSSANFWPTLEELVMRTRVPLVSGTTGIEDLNYKIKRLADFAPVFYASNFSLGIQYIKKILQLRPETTYNSFLIEEIHHLQKKDKPSGTALDLASILGIDPTTIRAVRAQDEIGTHQVTMNFDDQEIIIQHKCLNRNVFSKGALSIVPWLVKQSAGLYGFKEYFSNEVIK